MHKQESLSYYDKEKYREMILDAAETVLGLFGFDRTVYGNIKKKKNSLEVLDTTTKAYSIDKKIDYFTVRSMVIQSLENIVREELNRHIASINLHKIAPDIQQEDK